MGSQEFAELLSSKDDDDMVLEKLKPLVALFAHCSERDAYIALHTEFLGRRLLLNKSVSICRERQIMQRLQDCFDTCTIDLLDYYGRTTGSFYLGDMQIGDIDADSDAPQLKSRKLRDDFAQVSILYLPGRHLAKWYHNPKGLLDEDFLTQAISNQITTPNSNSTSFFYHILILKIYPGQFSE